MKKLLEKYWNELEHYKNGGKLAGRRWVIDPNDGDSSFTIWYEIDSCSTWMMKDLLTNPQDRLELIINDDYKLYRKALVEGKTIEYLGQTSNVWHEIPEPDFNLHPTCYRIKPDEPKFKVGDFVTPLNRDINCSVWKIDKVLSCNTLASGIILLDPRTIQPWTPVKGEWCWFYDSSDSRHSHLAQFYGIHKSSASSISTFMSSKELTWYYCEPFLNSLPSYLKDK